MNVLGRLPRVLESFSFRFHSNGSHSGDAIALDLLPHAFSLLHRLLPDGDVTRVVAERSAQACQFTFVYGNTTVNFDFAQGANIPKRLDFSLNGVGFQRSSRGSGATYRTLLLDAGGTQLVDMADLFQLSWREFLRCFSSGDFTESYRQACRNVRDTAQLMFCEG